MYGAHESALPLGPVLPGRGCHPVPDVFEAATLGTGALALALQGVFHISQVGAQARDLTGLLTHLAQGGMHVGLPVFQLALGPAPVVVFGPVDQAELQVVQGGPGAGACWGSTIIAELHPTLEVLPTSVEDGPGGLDGLAHGMASLRAGPSGPLGAGSLHENLWRPPARPSAFNGAGTSVRGCACRSGTPGSPPEGRPSRCGSGAHRCHPPACARSWSCRPSAGPRTQSAPGLGLAQ